MAGHNGNPGGAGGGNADGNKGGSGDGSNGGETNRGKGGKGALATVGALVLALAAAWLGIDGTGGTDDGTDGNGNGANGHNAKGNDGNRSNGGGNGNRSNGDNDGGESTGNADGTRLCPIDTLPPQTDDVVDRILTNQDHIHSAHDGKHFGNYEGVLPKQHGSYYREYTVDTPGLNHRGARRIVVGGGTEDDPDVWYYTDDHFESFCKIPDAED